MKITKQRIIGNPLAGNFNYSEQDNDIGRLLSAMTQLGPKKNMIGKIKPTKYTPIREGRR